MGEGIRKQEMCLCYLLQKTKDMYLLYEAEAPVALLFSLRRLSNSSSKCHSDIKHILNKNGRCVSGESGRDRVSVGSDSGRGVGTVVPGGFSGFTCHP